MDRVHFTSNKNDHTFGRLLLWPPGWQVDTRFADEPIMTALAGDDENPAIPGFDPDVGAELYTTNGDTNDHMYQADRVLSFTPEGSPGVGTGSGFIFQDVEADVQEEFEKHVQFALDLARSADDASRPDSHLGNKAPNFVVDDFAVSYGNPQTVQVNARRDLGKITLRYQVNGGRIQTKSTQRVAGRPPLRRRGRLLVPPHARHGHRHGPRRHREGVVHLKEEAPHERLLHLQGALRLERGRARAGRGGLQRQQRVAAVRRRDGPELPLVLHRGSRRHPARRVRLRRRGPQGAGPARGAEPLRRGDLVHGQRQRHAHRPNAGRGGPGGASHDHRGA